ncbi:isoaspartyl peptidase/L-asparaginase family protein [Acaryochloris sp. IP29b_bin.148]|uniref:isoaspartyl peptidase/L-asparaginase family protein n=1 Tax=Acaryochloris sp. IP29b_bin.148 TaxID=2969218 RepID=UPI0026033C0F|nr:isoaspartyl peptidase/L-asparaginase family protein [Acaryochloris sp. IP29b_bin.148]
MSNHYSLMIHGGAGALQHIQAEGSEEDFAQSMYGILEQGRLKLQQGAPALDVVEHCVSLLEDDPLYNAGRGSVLNEYGEVEMDAAIMDGQDLAAGSVAGIKNIKNPISLARLVLKKSEHVMLIGHGAMEFAELWGVECLPDDYFIIESRIKQFQEAEKAGKMMLDHEDIEQEPQRKFGTVGATAFDLEGNLAAATSTGGIVNKRWGRVGDSPIIGAGVFADNDTCAVSATGYGEQFMRTVLAKMISDCIHFQSLAAPQAAQAGIEYLVAKVKGLGGVIVIDAKGRCGAGHSTSGMIYGWIEHGGESHFQLT